MTDQWRAQASCAGVDPELFYASSVEGIRNAKRWCSICPVQSECLTAALEMESRNTRHGIWGGLTVKERHRLIRRQRPAKKVPA